MQQVLNEPKLCNWRALWLSCGTEMADRGKWWVKHWTASSVQNIMKGSWVEEATVSSGSWDYWVLIHFTQATYMTTPTVIQMYCPPAAVLGVSSRGTVGHSQLKLQLQFWFVEYVCHTTSCCCLHAAMIVR